MPPGRAVRALLGWRRCRSTLLAAVQINAALTPEAVALIDDDGALGYAELARLAEQAASALRRRHGIRAGDTIAVMCRNHRSLVLPLLAAARLGADVVLVNTASPAPMLAAVLAPVVGPDVAAVRGDLRYPPAARLGRTPRRGLLLQLTSGTTGVPRAAPRAPRAPDLAGTAVGLIDTLGLRRRSTAVVATPLFHGMGFLGLTLALGLGATVVLRPRFSPRAALADVAAYGADVLLVVPHQLPGLLAVPGSPESLRAVVSGGAPLRPALGTAVLDAWGEVLYNVYGSTEAGVATIASPADLRAVPGTVGRPLRGATVQVRRAGREVATGETGNIVVGNALTVGGVPVATGDVGRRTADGLLVVTGRADDMIVSGGENVFPLEVEDLICMHPGVADAAVVGVADGHFGQRLAAYVVLRPGATVSADDIIGHVRARLERFKVPRDVIIVDALPRTATGKLRRADFGSHPGTGAR